MPPPNLATLRAVADRLDRLGLDYAFVGGAVVNLLLDNPGLSPARPTDDFDVILEAVTAQRYANIEARLRQLGFHHDMREGAPRWDFHGFALPDPAQNPRSIAPWFAGRICFIWRVYGPVFAAQPTLQAVLCGTGAGVRRCFFVSPRAISRAFRRAGGGENPRTV